MIQNNLVGLKRCQKLSFDQFLSLEVQWSLSRKKANLSLTVVYKARNFKKCVDLLRVNLYLSLWGKWPEVKWYKPVRNFCFIVLMRLFCNICITASDLFPLCFIYIKFKWIWLGCMVLKPPKMHCAKLISMIRITNVPTCNIFC